MTELALTLAILFIVFFSGYVLGRNHVIREIRQMTKELENDMSEMQSKIQDN